MSSPPDYFVHESAYIDEPATIGVGTKIWHFSHILAGARIGERCVVGQNVNVGGKAVIGNGVKIQNNVSVYDGVTLEDDVFCGPSMVFTNVRIPRAFINRRDELVKTLVKTGASIGANATVVCGVTIGRFALIGAGAVVTRDVPDHALVVGVPGKIVGYVSECGETLVFDQSHEGYDDREDDEGSATATCICGNTYRKWADQVQKTSV